MIAIQLVHIWYQYISVYLADDNELVITSLQIADNICMLGEINNDVQ